MEKNKKENTNNLKVGSTLKKVDFKYHIFNFIALCLSLMIGDYVAQKFFNNNFWIQLIIVLICGFIFEGIMYTVTCKKTNKDNKHK